MRKKYLSALLFGALLFASAGTFTSCKDYDDDINNLQEQINTVKTDLESLKSTVEGLDGVKTLSYADGMLIIETGKGTKVEVPVPSATGITTVELKDNVLYVDGKEAGKVEIAEGEAIKVEVKEDGKLYINDEVQDLEIGSKVAVVDNGDGSYTLTVDGKSYVLPKATSSVGIRVTEAAAYDKNYYFTNLSQDLTVLNTTPQNGGIYWGTADRLLNPWEGLKPVVKGQLLVGQIKTVDVVVTPATFDLGAEDGLSLVNSLGQKAPVTVKAVSANNEDPYTAGAGSRAADPQGAWKLQIAMDNTITTDNIGKAFANEDNTSNMCYALALDGKVLTDYKFIIDTQKNKSTREAHVNNVVVNFYEDNQSKDVTSNALPLGETELFLTSAAGQTDADLVYDSYIEIVNTDMAERYEISANGMVITTTNKAGEIPTGESLEVKLHIIDINGNVEEKTMNLDFGKVLIEDGDAIENQTFTVIPNFEGVLVDLGNTFTSLSATTADKVSSTNGGSVTWETTADAATFANASLNSNITYFETKEDALAGKNAINVSTGEGKTIRKVKYAVVSKNAFKASSDIYAGENNVTITLKDNADNELKKVTAKVTVALPAFDDVLAVNPLLKTWSEEGVYATRMIENTSNKAAVSFYNAFISKEDANENPYFDKDDIKKEDGTILSYELTYVDPETKKVKSIDKDDLDALIVDNKLVVNELTAVVSAELLDKGANFSVTKEFKVNLKSIFDGAQFVYYDPATNAKVEGAVTLPNDGTLAYGSEAGGKKSGLFIEFDGYSVPYVADGAGEITVAGLTIKTGLNSDATPTNSDEVNAKYSLAAGSTGELTDFTGGITITVVSGGKEGVFETTFTDANGVKTKATLPYKK